MAGQGFGEVARNEIVKVKRLMVLLLFLIENRKQDCDKV